MVTRNGKSPLTPLLIRSTDSRRSIPRDASIDVLTLFKRIRYQVMSAAPLNYVAEANKLAELIKQYEQVQI